MQVTGELIQKLADLSMLEFSGEEKERVREDLQKMISFVEKINELNLDDTAPLLQVGGAGNVMRDDEVRDQLNRDESLRNAPKHDGKFFKVPRVVNKP